MSDTNAREDDNGGGNPIGESPSSVTTADQLEVLLGRLTQKIEQLDMKLDLYSQKVNSLEGKLDSRRDDSQEVSSDEGSESDPESEVEVEEIPVERVKKRSTRKEIGEDRYLRFNQFLTRNVEVDSIPTYRHISRSQPW